MKVSKNLCVLSFLIVISCTNSPKPQEDMSQYRYQETRDLVSFVNDAATLFSAKGNDAFTEFGKHNSKWFTGTKYIFIYDLTGRCVFHPVSKELVGRNMLDMKDMNGKPIIQLNMMIASRATKPYGWIHCLWAEPGEIFPSWKNIYIKGVKGPDGKKYAIGSGTYNIRTEIPFVVDIVDSAAQLVHLAGKEAYPQLLDKASVFYFNDSYLFVLTLNGKLLVDPSYPTKTGRDVSDFRDYAGHYTIRELLGKLKKNDFVYLSYMWPAPGQPNPIKKMLYARKVVSDNDTVVVGSSLYLMESIWKKF
ncbi:MAG: cache domain-containing protein [Bacteroidota bacterium]